MGRGNASERQRYKEGGREGGREGERVAYLMHTIEPLHKDGGTFGGRVALVVKTATTSEVVTEGDPVLVDQGLREGEREGGRKRGLAIRAIRRPSRPLNPPSLPPSLPPLPGSLARCDNEGPSATGPWRISEKCGPT